MDRTDPALRAGELTMLKEFLDHHRATLVNRVEGLTGEQIVRTHPPSSLTLAGLVKHLAYVEDSWFVDVMSGRDLPEPWAGAPFENDPDWEYHSAPADSLEDLLELYAAACDRSRAVVERVGDLDALSSRASRRNEGHFSLRWILLHMIEETARHNGHADLIRESIDGLVGE